MQAAAEPPAKRPRKNELLSNIIERLEKEFPGISKAVIVQTFVSNKRDEDLTKAKLSALPSAKPKPPNNANQRAPVPAAQAPTTSAAAAGGVGGNSPAVGGGEGGLSGLFLDEKEKKTAVAYHKVHGKYPPEIQKRMLDTGVDAAVVEGGVGREGQRAWDQLKKVFTLSRKTEQHVSPEEERRFVLEWLRKVDLRNHHQYPPVPPLAVDPPPPPPPRPTPVAPIPVVQNPAAGMPPLPPLPTLPGGLPPAPPPPPPPSAPVPNASAANPRTQMDAAPASFMPGDGEDFAGEVISVYTDKGYGMVRSEELQRRFRTDAFFRVKLVAPWRCAMKGCMVTFRLAVQKGTGTKGPKYQARDVRLDPRPASAATTPSAAGKGLVVSMQAPGGGLGGVTASQQPEEDQGFQEVDIPDIPEEAYGGGEGGSNEAMGGVTDRYLGDFGGQSPFVYPGASPIYAGAPG
eukprot:Hpha_TRINITY_DN15984_c2_g4::TRINITY_DN15984_c2_g4_i1::g.72852::m.72852